MIVANRLTEIAAELQAGLTASAVLLDHPLGPLTTYRVGGSAAVFVRVENLADLDTLSATTARHRPDVLVVGRGSNMLVADAGFAGLVIQLGEAFATAAAQRSSAELVAGAASSLPVIARQSVKEGLRSFEWAVGVPGSMGGAVRMNAGGHGSDMAANLRSVRIVDLHSGESGEVARGDLDLEYRSSNVAAHQLVVEATLVLEEGDPEPGQELLSEIVRWRREHQPGGQNAGSVFTNPEGDSAGRLIDSVGLKGHRHRSAQVSPKHANFIQADATGSADDIKELMAFVIARVEAETGVRLHPETRMVGFGPDTHTGEGSG